MNILYVNACVRDESRTNELAKYVISKFKGNVQEVNLNLEKILPLYKDRLELRDLLIKNKEFNHKFFDYANQFANADVVIVAAPYWDFSFPSILKTYIENINVAGITFSYSQAGQLVNLCKAKKLIYISTSGGPIIFEDFGFGYIKAVAENFYGIKDINYIKAEGLDMIGADIQKILKKAKQEIDKI